jgi:hypothetical protein
VAGPMSAQLSSFEITLIRALGCPRSDTPTIEARALQIAHVTRDLRNSSNLREEPGEAARRIVLAPA